MIWMTTFSPGFGPGVSGGSVFPVTTASVREAAGSFPLRGTARAGICADGDGGVFWRAAVSTGLGKGVAAAGIFRTGEVSADLGLA